MFAQPSSAGDGTANTSVNPGSALETGVQVDGAAAQIPQFPDDGQKRYLVELVILQNAYGVDTNTEIWDRFNITQPGLRSSAFESESAVDPTAGGQSTGGEFRDPVNNPLQTSPQPFPSSSGTQALPRDVTPIGLVHLAAPLRLLQLGNRYHVLKHAAWIQLLSGKREATLVKLAQLPTVSTSAADSVRQRDAAGFAAAPFPQVTGTVRIYENRLLFVEVDFAFRGMVSNELPGTQSASADIPRYGSDAHSMIFRINEKRRVKLNELHYLDHPYFGALIRVSRWGEEKDSSKSP